MFYLFLFLLYYPSDLSQNSKNNITFFSKHRKYFLRMIFLLRVIENGHTIQNLTLQKVLTAHRCYIELLYYNKNLFFFFIISLLYTIFKILSRGYLNFLKYQTTYLTPWSIFLSCRFFNIYLCTKIIFIKIFQNRLTFRMELSLKLFGRFFIP